MPSGLSGMTGFTWVRPWGRRVHPRWLGSLECALGVVGFIRVRWVHWSASWVSPGSSRVDGFTGVRPRGHPVHTWVNGFAGVSLGVVGSFRDRWVQ